MNSTANSHTAVIYAELIKVAEKGSLVKCASLNANALAKYSCTEILDVYNHF